LLASVQVLPWQSVPPQNSVAAHAAAQKDEAEPAAVPSHPRCAARESGRARVTADLPLRGNVWKLSRDPQGCRRVQDALAEADSDKEREAVAEELRGHVWQAVHCPHANHVVQQVIACMRASSCDFVVDEILGRGPGAVRRVARHALGCRVLQRMLEHWPDRAARLVDGLMAEGALLCRHEFGNYVMQHVLEYGSAEHRQALIAGMVRQAHELGPDAVAGGPLAKAIAHGACEDREALARALLAERRVLAGMACARHGHAAVQKIFELCEEPVRLEAMKQLRGQQKRLQACRYGRAVLHHVPDGCSLPAARGGA